MKTLPFLITILFLFFCFLVSVAHAQSRQITVTAYVPEHLTYYKSNQGLIISTNHQSGFSLLRQGNIKQSFQPVEQTFNFSEKNFLLVVNF